MMILCLSLYLPLAHRGTFLFSTVPNLAYEIDNVLELCPYPTSGPVPAFHPQGFFCGINKRLSLLILLSKTKEHCEIRIGTNVSKHISDFNEAP